MLLNLDERGHHFDQSAYAAMLAKKIRGAIERYL